MEVPSVVRRRLPVFVLLLIGTCFMYLIHHSLNYVNSPVPSADRVFSSSRISGSNDGTSESAIFTFAQTTAPNLNTTPEVTSLNGSVQWQSRNPDFTGYFEVPRYAMWVNSSGDLLSKIALCNSVLDDVRRDVLTARGERDWDFMPGINVEEIQGNRADFLRRLSLLPGMYTVILAWTDNAGRTAKHAMWTSLTDHSNLLIEDYYPWLGSTALCQTLRTPYLTNHRWDTLFDRQCDVDITKAYMPPKSMEIFFLNTIPVKKRFISFDNAHFPEHMYTDLPRHVFYVHVIRDSYVTFVGNVHTNGKKGSFKIVPYTCKPKLSKDRLPADYKSATLYEEVFVISQLWGQAYYHRLLESIPRMIPYLDFLKRNPNIKIQVHETGVFIREVLDMLGIHPSRLIIGPSRAKVVYLPQVSYCHLQHVQAVQYLAYLLRGVITTKIDTSDHYRRNLILIRRSGERHFSQQDEIARLLRDLAEEFGLVFYWFRDDPVPPLPEVMTEFYKAVMVVAPHGAGLSNLVFSQPGTQVIEGLCNPPETIMCFTRLAHILGQRYHGLISRDGCQSHVDIPAAEVADTVRKYLGLMRQNDVI